MLESLRSRVRQYVPATVRNRYNPFSHWRRETSDWMRVSAATTPMVGQHRGRRMLLVPCDPWDLNGSRGDDAMISAVLDRLRDRYPGIEIGAAIVPGPAEAAAAAKGLTPLPWWTEAFDFERIASQVRAFGADCCLVIGADVMDGYYSPFTTFRMLALADLASRSGAAARVLGFSFNTAPAPELRRIYRQVSPAIRFNLRDPVSLGRFKAFCGREAIGVADAAFMLQPDTEASPETVALRSWIAERRASGHAVMAFNVHPRLRKGAGPEILASTIASACAAITHVLDNRPVSIALVPHDYRPADTDEHCLLPIYAALRDRYPDTLFHLDGIHSARQLKLVASLFDVAVSGRMHFAVACLGSGVPVGGVAYQGKFHGLWDLFDLEHDFIIEPAAFNDPASLIPFLLRLFDAASPMARQVRFAWPSVLAASETNLAGFPE